MFAFYLKFYWSLFLHVQQDSSIVLDNGLVPSGRQAIIWNNDG